MTNPISPSKVLGQRRNLYDNDLPLIHSYLLQEAILLDVRTAQEYIKTKLPNARHAPMEQLIVLATSIKNWSRPVITYSTYGRRSAQAERLLRSQGVQVVDGGSRSNLANILSRGNLPA